MNSRPQLKGTMRVFLVKNYFFYFLSLGEIQAVGGWWLRYTPEKLLNFIDFAHEPILPNWRKNISLPRRPYVFEVHRYNTPTCPTCIIHQIVLFSSIFIQTSKDQDSLCFTVWVVKTEQVRELLLRIIIKALFLFHCMRILRTRQLLPSGCFCLMWTALRYTK